MDQDDKKFEQLARKYPDLIQKSQLDYLGVGDGWFNIIDCLCGALSYRVSQARYKLKYAQENQGKNYAQPIPEAEAELAAAIEELPTIAQIKEKFGTLRFYADGCTEAQENYIAFAEAMSGRTCEVCGSPGETRNDNWIKVLCDKHDKERKEEEKLWEDEYIKIKTKPNLFDD